MIPKIIHLCWLSGDPYPRKIQDCLDSWKKHLPSYEIILWDTKRFNIHEVPWVEQAFNTKKYAFAADYIRLYALYHHGGIYLDSDVEILKSLDNFLELPYFVGAEPSGTIEAAILGAEKGCDWIKCCLDYYEGRNFIREDGSYDIRMLPEILNETILRLKPVINMPSGSNIDDLKKKHLLSMSCPRNTSRLRYSIRERYSSPLRPMRFIITKTHGFRIRLSPTTVHGHYSSRYSDTRP